jgi:peptide/nickel transport system ATP-binding protein
MTPALDVRDLCVDIEVPTGTLHAVRHVSFAVAPEETFCLVGESGCGKTMTSLAIMNLLPKRGRRSAERLALGATDLLALDERALAELRGSEIAMIFQDATSALNPVFRVGAQLEEVYRRHRGTASRAEARERAESLLNRLGISAPRIRLRQYPHELSGGMRQRVMIAMALMCEPRLVIADEPTTALDVTVQAQILELLVELQQEFKLSLLLIAHDLGVVANVAHRVAVMYAGEIVETGSVDAIFAAPTHPYTRKLLGCIPRRGRPLGSIPGMVPPLIGALDGCLFRNRCDLAGPDCERGPIALTSTGSGRAYRCVRSPEQLAAARAASPPA